MDDSTEQVTEPRYASEPLDLAEMGNRVRAGEAAAEAELIRRLYPAVRTLVRRRLPPGDSEIDDYTQEAFRILLAQLRGDRIREHAAILAFLQQTVVHLTSGERLRRRRSSITGSEPFLLAVEDPRRPEAAVDAERLSALIRRLIDELPAERDRRILRLRYLEDCSCEETCSELGLTPQDFHRILSRARQRLRSLANEHGIGPPPD